MNVAITGANRGIGLALSQLCVARGDNVFAICRESSPELNVLNLSVIEGVDVRSESFEQLSRRLPKLDLLLNNAGILHRDNLDYFDSEKIRQQFEVNALGPLRFTRALLQNLGPGSKVALVSSRMGSLQDNTSGRMYGYRMSKAALNMAGVSLAVDLKAKGISVTILHPGYVRTDMSDGKGPVEPLDSARGLLKQIDNLNLESSGSFWHANGQELPW